MGTYLVVVGRAVVWVMVRQSTLYKRPAIQDQRLKTRVCDKIVYCINWQVDLDFANLISTIDHIASILAIRQIVRS